MFAYPLRGGRRSGEKHLKMDRPTAVVRLQLLLLPATAVFLCLSGTAGLPKERSPRGRP